MVAFDHHNRIPPVGSNPVPPVTRLAERVRHYFDQHPGVAREEFCWTRYEGKSSSASRRK